MLYTKYIIARGWFYLKVTIASKLKKLRSDLGYSTEYVSLQLKKLGFNISPNTLYNYENGVSQPKADMFLSLCKIYNIDNFNVFFDEEPAKKNNKYNSLNILGKQKADEYINDLSENPKYTNANVKTISDDITEELKQVSINSTKIK